MNNPPKSGEMLHLRGNALDKGDPVALPLTQSSMFHLPGAPDGHATYGRVDNLTWVHLEHVLSHLENAPCLTFPSGMGAISAALFATVKAGSRILIPSDGYYVTRLLADRFLSNLGVSVEERPTLAFADGGFDGFDVVFVESPSNPGLDMIDLGAVAREVRAAGGITIADNTTLTPLGQRPFDLGVDIVVSSDTKAMGGHSDLLMGHVASRSAQIMERIEEWRRVSGAIPGPHEAWLLHRGLETLDVRFDRMCASAQVLAERFKAHKAVQQVRYPGLLDDPSYAVAQAQTTRFGFLLSITLEDEVKAERFINTCPLLRPATSFGGVHSSAERRARWGDDVDPAFVRLSVGCEPVEELWQALEASLNAL
ncbi:cystathionine gamma-lyase [Ruegeria sp. EL01]|uniref:cystathionine gamma-lyase n=1 Tax=Ruegeria sp. EL01 TaxID=2107578 RepID=UPI000EA7FE8C|nr:cystathionine gamma-lyase [Ruegeria sp. EL01]